MDNPTYYSNNTKIINKIRKGDISGDSKDWIIVWDPSKGKENATIFSYEKGAAQANSNFNESGPAIQLSNFDLDVADAIYTIYKEETDPNRNETSIETYLYQKNLYGNIDDDYTNDQKSINFTTRKVLCTLSGDPRQDLTEKLTIEINTSIKKLMTTVISLNYNAEMKERMGKASANSEKVDDSEKTDDSKKNSDSKEENYSFEERPFLDLKIKEEDQKNIVSDKSENSEDNFNRNITYIANVVDINDLEKVRTSYFMPLYYYAEQIKEMIVFKSEQLGGRGKIKALSNEEIKELSKERQNKDQLQTEKEENNKAETEKEGNDKPQTEDQYENRPRKYLRNDQQNIMIKHYLIRKISTCRNYLKRHNIEMKEMENRQKRRDKRRSWPNNKIDFMDLFENTRLIQTDKYKTKGNLKKRLESISCCERSILEYYISIDYITEYDYNDTTRNITFTAEPFE